MEIEICDTKLGAAGALSEHLEKWCRDEGFRSIALSGGSTPKIWFNLLSESYLHRLPWSELLLFWGDERCVPPTHAESNYRMTREQLLDAVPVPQEHIFRVRGEASPAEEAIRYSGVLENTLPPNNGLPCFDLVVLGMGDDGHTASIFPHELSLWDEEANCVVGTHPDSGQRRISITGRIINNARQVVFLVTGASKAEKVRQVIGKLPGAESLPASHVSPGSGRLLWLLDRDAASGLP